MRLDGPIAPESNGSGTRPRYFPTALPWGESQFLEPAKYLGDGSRGAFSVSLRQDEVSLEKLMVGFDGNLAPKEENAPKTVLVVDDEPSVLAVASKVLRRGGYKVIEAQGGQEALRLAEEHAGPIDLLLTDVIMPGMGGRQLSEAFRQNFPSTSILFMSAYTEDEVILQGVRVAEVDFISKPFSVTGLREKVRQVLDASTR